MKAVLISIKPYWVFLIIAKAVGWNIDKEKTVEVRKNYPKDKGWDKVVKIYCGKDKKSFAKIPKEYQPLMQQLLGKVIGEFICNNIDFHSIRHLVIKEDAEDTLRDTCITKEEMLDYLKYERGTNVYSKPYDFYGWHISDLVIYDKPKSLSDFRLYDCRVEIENGYPMPTHKIKRPPQSWCYVEEMG